MSEKSTTNEQRYWDAMKCIAAYESPSKLRRSSDSDWGLSPDEAIEMAYENVLEEAKRAVKGKKRPT